MIAQMIEPIMYFAIGFLLAALSVLVVAPLVHGRAVRLTMRRLEATIPLSMAEVQADKDLQRAEFAMSTRRLETTVEQLRTQGAGQLAELGRKGDAINRLKIELGTVRDQLNATEDEFAVKTRAALDAQRSLSEKESELAELKSELDERSSIVHVQKVDIITLKGQVEALKDRLAAGKTVKTEGGVVPLVPTLPMDSSQSPPPNNQRHEQDVLHFVPNDWPTAELLKAPVSSSQNPPTNSRRNEGGVVHFAPKDWPTAEVRSGGLACDPNARCDASDQCIGGGQEKSNFSAGLWSVEPPIRLGPRRSSFKNQFASDGSSIGRRPLRTLAHVCIAALIGIGGSSAWLSHGDEAMEMVRTWTTSLGWPSSISTTRSRPSPELAAAATSAELPHQLEAMPRDLAVVRRIVEQLTEKQEQMARNIATLQAAERDIKKKTSSTHLQSRAKLTPWPETKPKTIAGWTLREVSNGTAVLEGPNGIWRAMQGDTVPGVGKVESMVRWGSRLIVATSSGLISTP
jgi:hypothetical protein